MKTKEEIRKEIYDWIISKGVYLKKNDRKELKQFLQEYIKASDISKQSVNSVSSEKKVEVKVEKEGAWKPYHESKLSKT